MSVIQKHGGASELNQLSVGVLRLKQHLNKKVKENTTISLSVGVTGRVHAHQNLNLRIHPKRENMLVTLSDNALASRMISEKLAK